MNEAETAHRAALAAYSNGRKDEALTLMQRSIELAPHNASFAGNYGILLRLLGRMDDAMVQWRRAVKLDPDQADSHVNLAAALFEYGDAEQSLKHARRAIELAPAQPEPYLNLAAALVSLLQFDEAESVLRSMLARFPNHPDTLANLGNVLRQTGRLEDAIDAWRAGAAINPRHARTWINLGTAYMDSGALVEAIDAYRAAISADPTFAAAHSNLVYALHFDPRETPASILAAHRQWDERHARPLRAQWKPHENDRSPDRRLHIGYLSPDLRHHSVGRAMEPLLEHHDRQQFEVTCYSSSIADDWMTARLRAIGHAWHDVAAWTDAQVAERIRADGIDVLIDLSQHMAHNRMLAVARRPAPVQATFIGYPATTGVAAINYRITDSIIDPPGEIESFSTEQLIRLPRSFWCYRGVDVPVGPSPFRQNGFITFGSLNSAFKIVDETIMLWARVLDGVPGSRLIVSAPLARADDLIGRYERHGISRNRLELLPRVPLHEYLRAYDRIDIALDTIPYNGGVTTCDALWMGVPVISLRIATSVGRAGESILRGLALPECLASSPDEFVKTAVNLAADRDRLAGYRSQLRPRMQHSPICDEGGFTRDVENIYRAMWRNWCVSPLTTVP